MLETLARNLPRLARGCVDFLIAQTIFSVIVLVVSAEIDEHSMRQYGLIAPSFVCSFLVARKSDLQRERTKAQRPVAKTWVSTMAERLVQFQQAQQEDEQQQRAATDQHQLQRIAEETPDSKHRSPVVDRLRGE